MLSGLPATCTGSGEPVEPGCGSGCDGLIRSTELPPGLDLGQVGPEDARQIRRTVAIAYREHDAAVHAVTRVRTAHLAGGGGTDMRAGIAAASELRPRPDVLVVFTDGHTPWPHRPPPATAVIAAILGRREHLMPPSPAWARRIECHI